MENAGCIFYDENALDGSGNAEDLIAHEIAHQWFGNSATEKDWSHLWLSEGFATYLTNIYIEQNKGKQAFKEQLKKDRKRIVSFEKRYRHPIVDQSYKNLMDLLNPLSRGHTRLLSKVSIVKCRFKRLSKCSRRNFGN